MQIYTCKHIYVHIYVCIYVYIFAHTYTHIYIHIYMYICVYEYICMQILCVSVSIIIFLRLHSSVYTDECIKYRCFCRPILQIRRVSVLIFVFITSAFISVHMYSRLCVLIDIDVYKSQSVCYFSLCLIFLISLYLALVLCTGILQWVAIRLAAYKVCLIV